MEETKMKTHPPQSADAVKKKEQSKKRKHATYARAANCIATYGSPTFEFDTMTDRRVWRISQHLSITC